MKAVTVLWVDSCSAHGWSLNLGVDTDDLAIISVGLLAADLPDRIVLVEAQALGGARTVSCPMAIPKAAILEIRELRGVPPRWLKRLSPVISG